jgi:hypothetical protein
MQQPKSVSPPAIENRRRVLFLVRFRRPERPSGPMEIGFSRLRANFAIAGMIFLVALGVRLLFLAYSGDAHWPHSIYYEGDAPTWAEWAACLNRGQPFELGVPLRSPGVAYVLHWLTPLFGERNYLGFKTVWCMASAAACAVLFLAAAPLGRRVALIASGLLTFSFGSYITATSLNNEGLYALAIVLIAAATARLTEKPSIVLATACGALNGLATLLRPEHMLLVVFLAIYLLWRAGLQRPGPNVAAKGSGVTPPVATARGRYGALIMLAAFVLTCLPWSAKASRAMRAFNDRLTAPLDVSQARPPWTADALEYLNTLPPFVRADNLEYLTHLARRAGEREVTQDRVHRYFEQDFGYFPEPLPRWVFVSPAGPLNFALANHPQANGGFSKAGLDARLQSDPPLTLALPSHLKLVNHGYAIGWEYIRSDFGRWPVGRKLSNFADGLCSGLGAYNWPVGRAGVRRSVDIVTAPSDGGIGVTAWKAGVLGLVGGGCFVALWIRRSRLGDICLLVLGYKLIVTVLFYGYARQGVSVQPAAFVLVALACDSMLRRLGDRPRWRAAGWLTFAGLTALGVGADIRAAVSPAALGVRGPARLAPRWGQNAFEASETIELRAASQPSTLRTPPPESRAAP